MTAVYVKVGDRVGAGDPLARLDASDADQQLAVAQAQLAEAQARAALPASGSGSATSASASAASATTSPIATTTSAQAAPIAATTPIAAVNVVKGVAQPGDTAMEERSGALEVQADVAEQDVANVRRGQLAQITLPALGTTVRARVASTPTQASASSSQTASVGSSGVVTFPVTLALSHPGSAVLPGMTAQVALDVQRRAHVLYVPTTAIQGAGAAPTVQVLEDGRPVSRPVETGLSTNTSTEVVVGLRAGDTVVTGVVNPAATATVQAGGFGGLGGAGGGPVQFRAGGGGGFRRAAGGGSP